MERQTSWNFFAINHEDKTVTLTLSHIYNPQCKGCRADLTSAKAVAKEYGYRFVLKEPKQDHIGINGLTIKLNNGKVDVEPLDL
jgi:hypothetical protein